MSYVVLARKWRPQTFADLVGQEHVARTLANAIAAGRVAHAFLFTGVRGVGKTTSARILAKALECERGPTAEPCLQCAPCREIGEGTDIDVLEIDGATYTGIDKVRELQESLPYRPARDRFKIFVVDEVHMLSQPAWNAFLKTLEEPPPHVKFIFATTEVHKVPVTILSRCQRYDFKLIGATEIAARLRHVLDAEKVRADDEAIRVIAREAAGSMRDAMSLLDQVIAWAGEEGLGGEAVARVLGVAGRGVLGRIAAAVIDGNAAAALEAVGDLAHQGYALQNVARDFLQYLRDLVAAKVGGDPARLDLADADLGEVKALCARAQLDDLSRLYLAFSRAFDDVARSAQPRAAFEMALVRLARRPPLVPVDDLLARLADLERRLAGEGAKEPAVPKAAAGPDPAQKATGYGLQATAREAPPVSTAKTAPPTSASDPKPEARGARPSAAAPLEQWRTIIERISESEPHVASVFEQAFARTAEPGRLVIGFAAGSFAAAQVDAEKLAVAQRCATQHFGVPTVVEIDASAAAPPTETVAAVRSAERAAQLEEAKRRVASHPAVTAAMEVLGAELRDIRLSES
jgi:DNA polymerase III subunit gamma/tau